MTTLDLLRTRVRIGDAWLDGPGGAAFDVRDPASGERIASVPDGDAAMARAAIGAAHAALPAWRARPAAERAQVLRRMFDLLGEHRDALAEILTREQGKTLAEARGEIDYAGRFLEWFGEEAKRAYGNVIPSPSLDRRILVLRQPVGVVAAITPWNFPSAMVTRKLGPALAAGCTVVIKPASETPLSALALAAIAEAAGAPAGVVNVVTGGARAIGAALTADSRVRKLSFTGSTEVGRVLLAQCAPTIKRASMELGGNAPFIVFEDADLDAAVQGAVQSKFRNSGQTCVCTNRIYVQAGVYDAFVERLATAVGRLRVGPGLDPATDIGPLINRKAVDKVEDHIRDAVALGARVTVGGAPHPLGGSFFQPTVLSRVTQAMAVAREETFGPLAPVIAFETEAEVLAMANDTEFGLAAYVYARDLSRVWRVSEALECGMVGVNTGLLSTEVAPFGGVKQSGFGREGSRYGLEDYLDTKYLCLGL